jgi:hypothetical protein
VPLKPVAPETGRGGRAYSLETNRGGAVPSKRLFVALASVLVVASLVFAAVASGDHGKGRRHEGHGAKIFRSSLAPSVPTDPAIHGKTPGGVPWSLDRGEVSINSRGDFHLRLDGLVITGTNSARPVTTISASLFCGADANAAPAATTSTVPISEDGDARINERIALPATCLAPIVLVHPNGGTARYIALSGWKS